MLSMNITEVIINQQAPPIHYEAPLEQIMITMSQHSHLLQFRSVAQLCPTLCSPMDCSTPGFPFHHRLPEFTQTHVHQVGGAI